MSERQRDFVAFLARFGCDTDRMTMVAGDASNRKYYRLPHRDRTVIAMDAPPDKGEDVRPFVRVANWLGSIGLSAPYVFTADDAAGFVILEDLGDDLYARLFEKGHEERPLYTAAADVLWRLQVAAPPRDLEPYSAGLMAELAALSVVWYRTGILGPDEDLARELQRDLTRRFLPLTEVDQVMILRDYHAENLIWLPGREGVRRVGILDFQDAMTGHPAYDLVSVLQDARRDVDPGLAAEILGHFMRLRNAGPDFVEHYHLIGLQRNLRILGVFARLCLRDGKAGYVDLIPRVWGHILHDLDALEDRDLRAMVTGLLPAPDTEVLHRLRAQSA